MKKYLFMLMMSYVLISACSDEDDKTTPDQSKSSKVKIFTEQRQVLDKVKEVESLLQSSNDERLKTMDEQSQ